MLEYSSVLSGKKMLLDSSKPKTFLAEYQKMQTTQRRPID